MLQQQGVTIGADSILLTVAATLYYFALQPWAILARSVIIVFAVLFTKTATARRPKQWQPKMAAPPGLVETIEFKTKRTVTIGTAQNDQNLAKCHPQLQSPLYSQLPKELRDYIFELSCTQSLDERHAYDVNSYWYRPGHTARLKTNTSLLQTCRRIWLESCDFPMRQAEHAFWFQRGPYDVHADAGWRANVQNERDRYGRLFKSLTQRNLRNVSHIRVFMQMFQAQQMTLASRMAYFFPRTPAKLGFSPSRFTVTIRSTDWWDWEKGQALRLPSDAVQSILDSPFMGGVREFALELEAGERQADQLQAIIGTIATLEGNPKLVDIAGRDRSKVCKFLCQDPPRTLRWMRSPRIDNKDFDVYQGMETLQLRATTVVWKNQACNMPDPTPQAAYDESSFAEERIRAPGLTMYGRSPVMIFRPRAIRERLRTGGWSYGRFPEKEDELRVGSVDKAIHWQQAERARFEKMFGDIEARRLEAVWAGQGSLLRFTDQA